MTLVVIFGPPAVGKLAVARNLAQITGYKVLHNHMTIDLVSDFFEFGTGPFNRLVNDFRLAIVEEAAEANLPGLIFTIVLNVNNPREKFFLESLKGRVEPRGGSVYFVELEANLKTRLKRNRFPSRLREKKIDPVEIEGIMKKLDHTIKMNTLYEDFWFPQRYLKINNEKLSAREAALRAREIFSL